jgi:uncharacterized membrane protein YdjX (TVP38/TMEM64 family)
LIRRLTAFLARMDARAWRSLAVSFALFGGVGLVFLFGAKMLGISGAGAARQWLALARGPWALPAAVGAFAALAFLGVPQFVLIAAAVVAFGPWWGAIYSWIGTLASALVGFWLGRGFGARLLRDLRSERLRRFMDLLARNGFLASLVIRLAPFAPFVVVNMAAGVAAISWIDFVAGTGLGIVPKIALTAFAGRAAIGAFGGAGAGALAALAGAIVLWLGAAQLARRWLARGRAGDEP